MNTAWNKHGANLVRDYNQKMIYNLLWVHDGLSRADLTRITKMSPTSIGKIVGILIDEGFINETGISDDNKIGRKAVKLSVIPDARYAVGVDVDVEHIKAGIVNVAGEIILDLSSSNSADATPEQVVSKMVMLIQGLFDQSSHAIKDKIVGIGIQVPGVISWTKGVVHFSPQFRWRDFPIIKALSSRFDYEIYVENNAKTKAMAECLYGEGKSISDFIVIDIGSGMGSAIVTNKKLYRGIDNATGEIGHILLEPGGLLCDCGRRGCLQTYTCISGIEKRAKCGIAEVIAKVKKGEAFYCKLLDDAVRYSALGIANVVNYYNPALILIGGELIELYPRMADQIIECTKEYIWEPLKNSVKFKKSSVAKRNCSIISSASIVFHKYLMSDVEIQSD